MANNPPVIEKPSPLALRKAPDSLITNYDNPYGPLPVIGSNGEQARKLYAHPFTNPQNKPIVSIIVSGIGHNAAYSDYAINRLAAEITFSFLPHANDLSRWIAKARNNGHEAILDIPMEASSLVSRERKQITLLTQDTNQENRKKLQRYLAKAPGIIGITNNQGNKFLANRNAVTPLLGFLSEHGLLFLESITRQNTIARKQAENVGAAYVAVDVFLDPQGVDTPLPEINRRLERLAILAVKRGFAVGAGLALPETIDKIAAWQQNLEARGIMIAPLSAQLSAQLSTQLSTQPQP